MLTPTMRHSVIAENDKATIYEGTVTSVNGNSVDFTASVENGNSLPNNKRRVFELYLYVDGNEVLSSEDGKMSGDEAYKDTLMAISEYLMNMS